MEFGYRKTWTRVVVAQTLYCRGQSKNLKIKYASSKDSDQPAATFISFHYIFTACIDEPHVCVYNTEIPPPLSSDRIDARHQP